jgi:hypothetical protein
MLFVPVRSCAHYGRKLKTPSIGTAVSRKEGTETETKQKDGRTETEKPLRRKGKGWPSLLSSLLPFPLSFLSFLSRSRTHERKQNFLSAHPLFFAIHPDFISVRRKRAFRSNYLFHICRNKNEKNMKTKNFEVTLLLVVNPSRDIDLDQPETKRVEFNVDANSEDEARVKAKELDTSGLSVWESWADEVLPD